MPWQTVCCKLCKARVATNWIFGLHRLIGTMSVVLEFYILTGVSCMTECRLCGKCTCLLTLSCMGSLQCLCVLLSTGRQFSHAVVYKHVKWELLHD